IIDWLHIGENDCFLVELPLHHINSTTFCLASLIAGASIAIPPRYSNSHFWEQAANSGATLTSIVPSIVFDQLGRTKEFSAIKNSLKLNRIQLGSAPVVASDALEFMQRFSIPLYQGYGQTETALRVTGVPMGLSEKQYAEAVAENSIGTPMKWASVDIADENGHIFGGGQEGELIVKGTAVMRGYIGNEPAFRNGYFLTGDIGYWKEVHGQRFFFLIGRSKEIIIKGGVNISPVAVENALKKIDADIEQAYVIGVEDKRYGEEVGAVIVWKEDVEPANALRRLKLALLTEHEALRAYETPKYLAVARADELPMTSTGKVQRTVLKKMLGGKMDSVYELMHSAEFHFIVIPPQSPLSEASQALYNHCWQPLVKSEREYKKYLGDYLTLGAIDAHGALAGQISFSYADNRISCVSICSASFKSKLVPKVGETPNVNFVREYLSDGHDPVMNFHKKLGAELVEVTPEGRPKDKSALGYTMLLRYPTTESIALVGPVSNQLIQAVRILARDVGAEVYAISRPGGLASYIHRSA
ncbi:MAG: fatty acid--CoA ligase family protein, partial [Patescibacteria group bacterium]